MSSPEDDLAPLPPQPSQATPADPGHLGSRGYVAWEDDTIALPLRFLRTIQSSLVALPRFARDLPGDGELSAPLGYAFLSTSPSMMSMAIVWSRNNNSSSLSMPVLVVGLLGQVFVFSAFLVVWSLALYWSARLFRVQGLSYRALLRIVCYASGLNGILLIPLLPWTEIPMVLYTAAVSVACIAGVARISVWRALGVYGTTAFLAVCTFVASFTLALMSTDS